MRNGLPIRYPITSLVPIEESTALSQKISYIDTKADANAVMSAVSHILLPLLPLLNGQIQDLVLLIKKFFTSCLSPATFYLLGSARDAVWE